MRSSADLPQLADEVDGVQFGDKRLNARLSKLLDDVARQPALSFPAIYEDAEESLEGAYRFFNNPRVSYDQIARGHARATLHRAREERIVIAAHDTSEISYGADTVRDGLGHLHAGGKGFFGHFALLLTADLTHRPLGIAASSLWVRAPIPEELKGKKNRKKRRRQKRPEDLESRRWGKQISEIDTLAGEDLEVIHVCDREADDYGFFAILVTQHARFVVRARSDRKVVGDPPLKLREKLTKLPFHVQIQVPISERKHRRDSPLHAKQVHPDRKARIATLNVYAGKVELVRPDRSSSSLPTLPLNVVWVHEDDCEEAPIDWVLYTTEPIDTHEQVLAVINYYRARWRIEEFFKALKSGCSLEKRQLVSYKALTIALAISLPIAWRLLLLRSIARDEPDAPATAVLSPLQIDVLNASLREKNRLGNNPTARQALLAVAALGGFQKHNGEPGWQIIGRGYEKLIQRVLAYRQGWDAAQRAAAPSVSRAPVERPKRCVES